MKTSLTYKKVIENEAISKSSLCKKFFNFQDIQIGRQLSELEVSQINYIIKNRAFRYIAAAKEEWLYPESKLSNTYWPNFGKDFLLMPDPRSSLISSGPLISYFDGRIDAYDIYGRKPHDQSYEDQKLKKKESEAFKAFRGDYARKFGPRRRGLTGIGAELGYTDDPESHTRNIKIPKLQNYKTTKLQNYKTKETINESIQFTVKTSCKLGRR